MGRYPRTVRAAVVKCIGCNAPVVITVEGQYVCVECGESPIKSRESVETLVEPMSKPSD